MILRFFERDDLLIVEEIAEVDTEYVHDVACHTDFITDFDGVDGGNMYVRHEEEHEMPGNMDEVRMHLESIKSVEQHRIVF